MLAADWAFVAAPPDPVLDTGRVEVVVFIASQPSDVVVLLVAVQAYHAFILFCDRPKYFLFESDPRDRSKNSTSSTLPISNHSLSPAMHVDEEASNHDVEEKGAVAKYQEHEHGKLEPIVLLVHALFIGLVVVIRLASPLIVDEIAVYLPAQDQSFEAVSKVGLYSSPCPVGDALSGVQRVHPVHKVIFAHVGCVQGHEDQDPLFEVEFVDRGTPMLTAVDDWRNRNDDDAEEVAVDCASALGLASNFFLGSSL